VFVALYKYVKNVVNCEYWSSTHC